MPWIQPNYEVLQLEDCGFGFANETIHSPMACKPLSVETRTNNQFFQPASTEITSIEVISVDYLVSE